MIMKIEYMAIDKSGANVYGTLSLSEQPTMTEIVMKLKKMGFKYFKVGNMKKLIKMPY